MEQTVTENQDKASDRRSLLLAFLRLLFDVLLLFVVLLLIGFLLFIDSLERATVSPPEAEAISVLTGGADRVGAALHLLAEGKGKRLLVSGVYAKTTKKELEKIAGGDSKYLECCVDLDHEAQNTIDNASQTSAWALAHHYRSVIIVTSNYHMPRALAELGRTMPGVDLVPYPVVDPAVHLDRWWLYPGSTRLLMSEYLKFLPAAIRLGATRLASKIVYGQWSVRPEEIGEP